MGQAGGFAHHDVIDHQQLQFCKRFLIGGCVRIGPQGIAGADDNTAQALGMVAENFLGHGRRRKRTGRRRRQIRGDGAPGLGITFIGVKSHGHHHPRNDITAADPEYTADRPHNMHKIGIEGAETSHVYAQIGVNAPAPGGHQTTQLAHLFIVDLADLGRASGIETLEPGPDFMPSDNIFVDIRCCLPAFFQDDGDHGFQQQRIGTGPHGQVDIGYGSRFAAARIDRHKQPLGVLGKLRKHDRCPRHLVTLHPVPAPGHQHFRLMLVRTGDVVLFAEYAAGHPPGTAKFLTGA